MFLLLNKSLPPPPPWLQEKFHAVLLCSELCRTEPELLERLWTACADAIFSLTQRETQLGFKEEVCVCGGGGGGEGGRGRECEQV